MMIIPQYTRNSPWANGKPGGQTLIGGTASGNDLTLQSTSHATKGNIFFGSGGTHTFDEVNNRWGFGVAAPARSLEVRSTSAQQRWSYDATYYVDSSVGATGAFALTMSHATTISIGSGNSISAGGTLVLGHSCTANQAGNIAIGYSAAATGNNTAIAIGYLASAAGARAISMGQSAVAGGLYSVVIGPLATDNNAGSIVIGSQASSNQIYGTAIGYQANCTSALGVALGYSASAAGGSWAVAIGPGATTTDASQFVSGSTNYPINNVYFGKGVTNAVPTAWTLNGTGGSGTNIAGGVLQIAGGKGTGNAAGGSVKIQASTAGASGTTLQTLATVAEFGPATIGFYGVTPVARPAAYTQTYSTADRTLAAYTADNESAAYTGIDNAQVGTVYAQLTDLNALRTAYENLRAFVEDLAQHHNSVLDDLQAVGLLQ